MPAGRGRARGDLAHQGQDARGGLPIVAVGDLRPVARASGGQVIQLPAAPTQRTTFTRVADNFYPYDAGYRPLPRAGFTHLNLVAPIVGQSAGVRVTPADPEHMLIRPSGIAYVSVTNSTDSLDPLRQRLEGVPLWKKIGRGARH